MRFDAAQILATLPQTQCTRCGYPDCKAYAQAITDGNAAINQCPPGGQVGIERLSAITGHPVVALNPLNGSESVRVVAYVDEDWCIGCTLCIKACPTDAIVGSHKRMHTVLEQYCTGCELCLPVCPVDCILLEPVSGESTGWAAWSTDLANLARDRYAASTQRRLHTQADQERQRQHTVQEKLTDLASHSQITDPATLERKRQLIAAAMEKARSKRGGLPG